MIMKRVLVTHVKIPNIDVSSGSDPHLSHPFTLPTLHRVSKEWFDTPTEKDLLRWKILGVSVKILGHHRVEERVDQRYGTLKIDVPRL